MTGTRIHTMPSEREGRAYCGFGTLLRAPDTKADGGFDVAQADDASISATFYGGLDAVHLQEPGRVGAAVSTVTLSGRTIEGASVTYSDAFIRELTISTTGTKVGLMGGQLDIEHCRVTPGDAARAPAFSVVFDLVNLAFAGDNIGLDVDGKHVEIEKCHDYDETVRHLRRHHGINATCRATVESACPGVTPEVLDLLTDTCMLLSLATGTRVAWTSYDVYWLDRAHPLSSHYMGRSITHPFSDGKPLIPQNGRNLGDFVTQTMARYREGSRTRHLRELINMYLMAKLPYLYIGSRIMLICQCIEAMTKAFSPEFIVDEAELDLHVPELSARIRDAWQTELPSLRVADLKTISGRARTKGLARVSLRRALFNTIDSVGLQHDTAASLKKRVGPLVQVRNTVTHSVLDYPERSEGAWSDYCGFVNMFDVVVLHLLSYKGQYHDIFEGFKIRTLA